MKSGTVAALKKNRLCVFYYTGVIIRSPLKPLWFVKLYISFKHFIPVSHFPCCVEY